MNKKLVLSGLVVSSLCLSQFSSCSDDGDDEEQQQQVPNDSKNQYTDTATVSGEIGNYSYVDLGLKSGLKWATYNVGATKVTDYGDYFTWASTEANKLEDDYCLRVNIDPTDAHMRYSWYVYLLKYNSTDSTQRTDPTWGDTYGSHIDSLTVLESVDDAASVNWGSSWRMPTKVEIDELIEGCTWTWVDNYGGTGISGQMGTSKANGNTIFLPAAGVYSWSGLSYHVYSETTSYESLGKSGYYWSSTLDESDSNKVYSCLFGSSSVGTTSNTRIYSSNYIRAYSVRAVSE